MKQAGIARCRRAGRLAVLLLAATCLTPFVLNGMTAPALADGGTGGTGGGAVGAGAGGPGGTGFTGQNGGDGTDGTFSGGGGGGGGGAAGGGNGGDGGVGDTAAGPGGSGGTSTFPNGQPGFASSNGSGGGGGGGGFNGNGSGAPSITNSSTLNGGTGGGGGSGGASPGPAAGGGGGGGGGGGYGAIVTGSGTANSNSGTVSGGAGGGGAAGSTFTGGGGAGGSGGNGGDGGVGLLITGNGTTFSNNGGTVAGGGGGNAGGGGNGSGGGAGGNGGNGGNGGVGLLITGSGATITNSGTISGGAGGGSGAGGAPGGTNGSAGSDGAGIFGSGLQITNSGTISGGGSANAITFTGGSNTLTLQAGSVLNGNIGIQTGSVTFNQSTARTLGNVITGAGSVIQNGTGTLTLSGANTYSGGTTINAAILQVASDGNLGNASGTLTFGGGTLQTTASFTMSRATTLNAGGGTFNTAASTTLQQDGAIGGAGSLTKTGTGTLTLTNVNNYTGATAITGGTLAVTSGFSILNSSGLAISSGATFDTSASPSITGVQALTGSGTVQQGGGAGLAILAATGEFSGQIVSTGAGTGGLEIAGGTQTLSGANTYTNVTQIDQGATLALKGSGSIANSASVTFAPSASGVATLDISQTTSGASVAALFDFAGVGVVSLGSQTLTITSGSSFAGVIQDGGIGGGTGGSLIISACCGQDLSGVNTYTGSTTITAGGLLSLSGNGSIATSSGLNLTGTGAFFDISGASSDRTIQALSGVAGSSVLLGNNNLIVSSSSSTAFAGVIDGAGGTGGLIKQGSGTLTLTGANTYTGVTTVTGGLINFTAGNNLGSGNITLNGGGLQWATGNTTDISSRLNALGASGATFDTNGNNVTLATAIGGTGGVTKSGTGTLTLSGNNGYTGGTTISAGVLSVSNDGNLGGVGGGLTLNGGTLQTTAGFSTSRGVTLNSTSTFQVDTGTLILSGAISGSGGLTKTGNGTLELSNTSNNYSGGTTVSGGILQGDVGTLKGDIVDNAQVVFNHLAGLGTYAGNISGTGSVTISGFTGTAITFSGINSYTGGTTLNGTTGLQGTTSSVQGNIVNNSFVNFNQSTSGTYSGNMTGTGSLGIFGTGTVIMTGISSVGGGTFVNGGRLAVNGSLTSNVTVNAGGNLGGSGTITGNVANAGTISPGNSIGTINVVGNYTQSGVYAVEVNAAGQSDLINVTGTATLTGGTVAVQAQAGTYARNTRYTILTATGGLGGTTYAGVSSNFAFLTPSLSYDANDVFLTLQASANSFASGAQTPNQRAVGTALDRASPTATGDFATVLDALYVLSTTQGPAALTAISGQQYANLGTVNVQAGNFLLNTFGAQLWSTHGGVGSGTHVALAQACDVACDTSEPPKFGAWLSGVGGLGSVPGNYNSGGLTYSLVGTAAGIDYRLDPKLLVGVGVGYISGTQWVSGFSGQGLTNSISANLYASFTPGDFYVDAVAGYANATNRMTRAITISGLGTRVAQGQTGADQFLGQLETGYKLAVGVFGLTPFGRLQASTSGQAPFTETGANSLNLSVGQQTTNSLRTTFGADLTVVLAKVNVDFRVGWLHEYADTGRPMTASFAGAPTSGFTVFGATPQRDSAALALASSARITDAIDFYARYDGEVGGGTDNHSFTGGFRMTW